MAKPYKEVNPGEPILAADWNRIQADIRQHILTHTHAGSEESGAKIDVSALVVGADMALRKLSATDSLTVGSLSQPLLSVNPSALNQEGSYQVNVAGTLRADQVRTSRLDGITGLAVGALAVTGNVGIGMTEAPQARLEVNGDGKFTGAVITTKLVGGDVNDTLDIFGAGQADASRKLTLWAEGGATVEGGLAVRGALTVLNQGLTVSGATALIGAVTVGAAHASQNLTVIGAVTATTLHGDGANLANLDASRITSGMLAADRIPTLDASKIARGTLAGAMTILESGNVGIGATSPAAKLEVAVGDADAIMKPFVIGKGTTNYLTVLNNGNIGIGAPSPSEKLQISGGKLQLDGNQQIKFSDSDTTNNLKLQLWSGYGLGINDSTLFYAGVQHSWRALGGVDERMVLTTGLDGGLAVKGTGFSSFAGSVGIGTPSPGAKLEVAQRSGLAIKVEPASGASVHIGRSDQNSLQFDFANGQVLNSTASMSFNIDTNNDGFDSFLDFRTNGAGFGGGALLVRILENGNVGIGAPSPGAKLEVNGIVAAMALRLGASAIVERFDDSTLSDSSSAVPSTRAIKAYIDSQIKQLSDALTNRLNNHVHQYGYTRYQDIINIAVGQTGNTSKPIG